MDLVHQLQERFVTIEILGDDNHKIPLDMGADEDKLVNPEQLSNDKMDFNANNAVTRHKPMPSKANKMKKSTKTQKTVEYEKGSSSSSSLSSSSSNSSKSSSDDSSNRNKKKKK